MAVRLIGLIAAVMMMPACAAHGSRSKDAPVPITGRGLTAEVLSHATHLKIGSYSGLNAVRVALSTPVVTRSSVDFVGDGALKQIYVETAHHPDLTYALAKTCQVLPDQLNLGWPHRARRERHGALPTAY